MFVIWNLFFVISRTILVFYGSSLLFRVGTVRKGKIVRYVGEKPPGSPNRIVKNMVMESYIMVMDTELLREVLNIFPVWTLKIVSNELKTPGKDVKKMIMDIELFQDAY
jgi:hypothetical protein